MPSTRSMKRKKSQRNSITVKSENKDLNIKDVPKVIFRINPDLYSRPVTRGLKKMLNHIRDFIIIEVYRCMPLLGNEEQNAPDWTVHYVRYDIVFIDKQGIGFPSGSYTRT